MFHELTATSESFNVGRKIYKGMKIWGKVAHALKISYSFRLCDTRGASALKSKGIYLSPTENTFLYKNKNVRGF